MLPPPPPQETSPQKESQQDEVESIMPTRRYSCHQEPPEKSVTEKDSHQLEKNDQTDEENDGTHAPALRRLSMLSQVSASTVSSSKSFSRCRSCISSTPSLHRSNAFFFNEEEEEDEEGDDDENYFTDLKSSCFIVNVIIDVLR